MDQNNSSVKDLTIKVVPYTEKSTRVKKSKWEQRMEPVLRDIIEQSGRQSIEMCIAEFYLGACNLFGSIDDWPEDLYQFYGQIQLKLEDPDIMSNDRIDLEKIEKGRTRHDRYISTKESQIINRIKNKWLSLQGVNFKGRRK